MRKRFLLTLVFGVFLSGCGAVQSPGYVEQTLDLKEQVQNMKVDACRAWIQGAKVGPEVSYADIVIMPLQAASKFQELAEKDASYEFVAKSAFVLLTFNGHSTPESMKSLLAISLADIARVCASAS